MSVGIAEPVRHRIGLVAHGRPAPDIAVFVLAHGNDERISTKTLEDGVELLWQMVLDTAGEN
jgi:hypothetical protein